MSPYSTFQVTRDKCQICSVHRLMWWVTEQSVEIPQYSNTSICLEYNICLGCTATFTAKSSKCRSLNYQHFPFSVARAQSPSRKSQLLDQAFVNHLGKCKHGLAPKNGTLTPICRHMLVTVVECCCHCCLDNPASPCPSLWWHQSKSTLPYYIYLHHVLATPP